MSAWGRRAEGLSTPLLTDACVRLQVPLRLAPPGLRPDRSGARCFGRVLPARHHGSVDVFLEALEAAEGGDVLVIDNDGRLDEGCIGDLVALEAWRAGLAGILVWGVHRDAPEVRAVPVPVFSYGAYPAGPARLDARPADALQQVRFGPHHAGADDLVLADEDGAIFVGADRAAAVLDTARRIQEVERRQAESIRAGTSLREQLQFGDYLEQRRRDPGYTLRRHLRRLGGAIEE